MAVQIVIFTVDLHQEEILPCGQMHLDVARLICDGINCITDAEGSDDPVPCTVREADTAGLHTVAQDHAAEERVEICFVGVGAIGIKGASRVDRVDLAGLFDILHAQDTLGIDFSLMPGADGKRQKRSVFLRQNTGLRTSCACARTPVIQR